MSINGLKCRLKEIRMKELMIESKSEFARRLEVEIHTYSNWENEVSTPNLSTAFMIAKKLNRHIEDIWYFE